MHLCSFHSLELAITQHKLSSTSSLSHGVVEGEGDEIDDAELVKQVVVNE